ncbi:MAG: hypothetical protein NPIRA06_24770 [Nitrospirales bacterium]|nr:MAG: hypothetical protein NPIRA06_24770 [Nitrospirales bacterium]
MVATIQNITVGVNLIDDYLLTQEAPVASQLTRQLFAVVQHPVSTADNACELLTINGDGDPVHFYPDASSQSGWSTTTISVTQPTNTGICDRILGFYHKNVLNALFYYPLTSGSGSAVVWMQSSQPGTWTTAPLSPTAEDWIGFTYQTDQYVDPDGNAYLYGITGNVSPHAFFILTYATDSQTGQLAWIPIAEFFPSQFSPEITSPDTAAFLMTEGAGGAGTVTVLWVDDDNISHQDATLTWTQNSSQFQWIGESATFNPNVGTLTANNLYGIPGDLGSGHLLILDNNSKLYLVSDFYSSNPTITALTGDTTEGQPGSATAVGIGVDASNIVTMFIIEGGSSNLWYLEQTETSSLSFGAWSNLGGTLYAVNCPPYMRAGPELFSAGIGTGTPAAYHTDQNLSDAGDGTYIWSTRKISGPPSSSDTTPADTATYSMELQAFDSGQNPVANGTVTVTADQAVTVIWNAIASHISPNAPLQVGLDANGQATVLYEAVGLTPPVITFTAYDTSEAVSASRWCRGDVIQYIQSLDDSPPPTPDDSVAPQLSTVTGSELISNNLTGGDYSQSGPADSAAQAINSTGGYMIQNANDQNGQGAIDVGRIKVPHWQIDFTHSDGPRFRVLSDEEATDLLAGLRKPGEASGGIGKAFGDVAHFFKHEINQLEKFSATLQNDVLTIVFNDLAPFVISTIKQAGAACQTLFAKIRDLADEIYTAMQDVIAWLKMMFDWGDILNTHTAIKSTVTQTLTNMQNSIAGAEKDFPNYFSSLNAEITKVFTDLEQYFDNSTSFNGMANNAQTQAAALSGSGGNVLAATTILNKEQEYASKCKYIYSRSKSYFGDIAPAALAGLPPRLGDGDPTQSILQAVQTYILDPKDSQGHSYFTQYFDTFNQTIMNAVSDPSEFFDLIILTFLEAAKDLTLFIVGAIEQVLEAIIKLLGQALSAFQSMINTKIDIPIISWLWKTWISPGDDLTLLDLSCLIAAVPATILYKLLYGDNNPPFNSTTLNELTNGGLAWPAMPTLSHTKVSATQQSVRTQASNDYIVPLQVVAGLSLFFTGIVTVAADSKAANGEADDTAKTLSIISVVLAALQAGAGAPYDVFTEAPANRTNADNWAIGTWTASLAQLSCDTCFVALGATNTLTEFVEVVGPTADTALGICEEACGVVACIYQSDSGSYSGWDCTLDIVSPISESLRFMLSCGQEAATFLMVADTVLYLGTMAVSIPAADSD